VTAPPTLDQQLVSRLSTRFTEQVIADAGLAPAREPEVRESCEIRHDGHLLRLTCTITGSTYERAWDGSEAEAMALADEAADETAYLISNTPHYAWMQARR
jgi:hypothetical protein